MKEIIIMTNISKLALGYVEARNHVKRDRLEKVSKIVIHHGVTTWNGIDFASYFKTTNRLVNSTYVIGNDGAIYCTLKENIRPWTTGNTIDEKAITIEVANMELKEPYRVSDKAMNSLIKLVADIGERYDLLPITYTGDSKGTLLMHKWYASTLCPGSYLSSKFGDIARDANKIKRVELYRVQVGAYSKANTSYAKLLEKRLHEKGHKDTWIFTDKDNLIKVQVGAFASRENALRLAKDLEAKGFETYIP